MQTNGLDSLSPQRMHTPPAIALASLLPLLLLASCGANASDPVVARHMGAFYEAFVGRDPSRVELQQMTDQFIEFHALSGKNRDGIREAARGFENSTKVLRDREGSPAALLLRHQLITVNYFNPDLHNTVLLRLLVEPDPVLVADVRSRRLMTERDVVALANLRHFARSQGAPRHQALTRRQIDELVSILKATVGGNSGNMPQFFGEVAAFWAGVQQAWPDLNADQQRLARAYADRMWRVQMPVEMYGRLWGLDPKAALSRYADDVNARMASITHLTMLWGNLPFVVDSIFGR